MPEISRNGVSGDRNDCLAAADTWELLAAQAEGLLMYRKSKGTPLE
jgi:hypothetical protein